MRAVSRRLRPETRYRPCSFLLVFAIFPDGEPVALLLVAILHLCAMRRPAVFPV